MPMNSCEFRENTFDGSHIFLKDVNDILPICVLYILPLIWIEFGTGHAHKNVLGNHEF
jgi:hypothetical protein